MAELPAGTVFAGHRIDGVAGRGGMGVVYRATHLALDHVVALKVIAPELADDPRFRERFVRESRTAVSIRHPNVVQVRHAGEEAGVLFVTMDYVEGSDLRALISAERRIEPVRGALIISQVAAALDAAHERGLVHRDVKPGNVLIEERDGDEHVYLTDFGLTKRMSGATELTASGAFIGTLEYMAPEQIRGGELDARTDVYALGGVAFATLTGEPPFGRVDGDVAKLYAHLNDPVPRASERWPALPVAVDPVLQRAMAKKPDDRYSSAGEFARALEEVAIGPGAGVEPTVTAPVAVPFEPTKEATEETQPAEPSTVTAPKLPPHAPPPSHGRRRLFGALAGLAVVGAVVALVALAGGGDRGEDSSSAAGGVGIVGAPVEIRDFTLGVAARKGTVLVADRGANLLGVVDERTEEVERERVGADPESVFAGDPIVWVVSADGSISRFDLADGRLTPNATKEIQLGGVLQDVAVANQAAWVTARGGSVTRIDPSTGAIGVEIPVGADPYGVAVEPPPGNPDLVFVVNRGDGDVSVIDRISMTDVFDGEEVDRVDVGARPKSVTVADGVAWVTNTDDGTVSRIDASGDPPFEASTVRDVCEQPRDIASGFDAIWVSCGEGAVARIDPGSEKVASVEVGGSPEGIAVGDRAVWVAMGDAGTVVPITPEG